MPASPAGHIMRAVTTAADDGRADGPPRLAAAILAQAVLDALHGDERADVWIRGDGPLPWLAWLARQPDEIPDIHDRLIASIERRDAA